MTIDKICNRDVVVASRDMTVVEAAQVMREKHVGDLVIVDERDDRRVPCGILTDRDITLAVVAKGLDPNRLTIGEIMLSAPVVGYTEDTLAEVVETMAANGVRRIPIVDLRGDLVGMVTADDVVDFAAREMGALVSMISREQQRIAELRTGDAIVIATVEVVLGRLAADLTALARMMSRAYRREVEARAV